VVKRKTCSYVLLGGDLPQTMPRECRRRARRGNSDPEFAAWTLALNHVGERKGRSRGGGETMTTSDSSHDSPMAAATAEGLIWGAVCQEGRGKRRPQPSLRPPLRWPGESVELSSVSWATLVQSDIRGLATAGRLLSIRRLSAF